MAAVHPGPYRKKETKKELALTRFTCRMHYKRVYMIIYGLIVLYQPHTKKVFLYYFHFHTLVTVISGSLSPWHGASSGCGWRSSLRYGG
jgi:hypothetical protein